MLLSAQKRLKGSLSVLTNYTLSKCMTDPATTELTGPTITDPTNPDLDYSACDSDRRHVRQRLGGRGALPVFSNAVLSAIFGDWQIAPLVRWQSGSPFTVTTGVDNALSRHRRPARRADPRTTSSATSTVNNYLNPARSRRRRRAPTARSSRMRSTGRRGSRTIWR